MFAAVQFSQHASCLQRFRDPKAAFCLYCLCPGPVQADSVLANSLSLKERKRGEREEERRNFVDLLRILPRLTPL